MEVFGLLEGEPFLFVVDQVEHAGHDDAYLLLLGAIGLLNQDFKLEVIGDGFF